MTVLAKANRGAVDAIRKGSRANLAQIAAALVAKRLGREDHLDELSGGLSADGQKAIRGLHVWKAADGGVIVTRGNQSPEAGASLLDTLSHRYYDTALRAQLGKTADAQPATNPAPAQPARSSRLGLWSLPLLGPGCSLGGLGIGFLLSGAGGDQLAFGLAGAILGTVAFVLTAVVIAKRKEERFSLYDLLSTVVSNTWGGLFVGGLVGGIGMAVLSQVVGRPTGPIIAEILATALAGMTAGAILWSDLA